MFFFVSIIETPVLKLSLNKSKSGNNRRKNYVCLVQKEK